MKGNLRGKLLEKYYSLSINKKIVFSFIAAFSVLLALLALLTYNISSSILIQKAVENTEQNLRLVSEKLDLILDNAENYSKIVITDNTVQDVLSKPLTDDPLINYQRYVAVQDSLKGIADTKTFINAVIIYDRLGRIYDSGSLEGVEDVSRAYFDKFAGSAYGLEWADTSASNYWQGTSKYDVIKLFQKFNSDRVGQTLGLVELTIMESYIADQYRNIDIGKNGSIFIVNKQGLVSSHTDKRELYKSVADQPYFSWVTAHEGGEQFRDASGRELLVVSRYFPRLDWTIVGTVPVREIMKDNDILTQRFLALGIVFVLTGVILSFVIATSITKPLNKIKATVKNVQEGNLDVWLDLKSRDEIGALAREFNKMVDRTKTLMSSMVEEQKRKREFELAALQAQINPHFLYNTLESICALADLKRNADIVAVVNRLASFYRGVLSKGNAIIPMEDEIHITRTYLEILKVRYGAQLDYSFDIEMNVYRCQTVKLLLQPIVENSVYHGLKNKRGKGLISVRAAVDGDMLKIMVEDNGVGMKPEMLEGIFKPLQDQGRQRSFGLKSTDERIKLYFGMEYGLSVSSEYGAGTTVTVKLPAIRMQEGTE